MKKDKKDIRDGDIHSEKKRRKGSVFAFIVCVLLSLMIWLYVVNNFSPVLDGTHNDNNTYPSDIAQ
jgi:hypothetical protein